MDTASSGTEADLTPEWVIVSGLSPQAQTLYNVMRACADPRGLVQIRVSDLANLIGYSRGDKIGRYMRELERGGAVVTVRPPGRNRGQWMMREDPPDGYTGPRSLAEWFERRRAGAA